MTERPGRARWLIVLTLFVVYVLMFIDRVNISIAAKYIIEEFGISRVQMGAVFSCFVFGYALFQIPGGWLGDRFGPRRVLAGAIVWWSLFTAMTAAVATPAITGVVGILGALAVVRFLIGVGEAAAPPNGARVIANWMPPNERGLAFGVTFAGNMLGAALAPPLIVWIMMTWGWREGFYAAGAAGIFIAAVWWLVGRDRPSEHPLVGEAELAHIAEANATSAAGGPDGGRSQVLLSPRLWAITGAYLAVGYILYLYFSWFYLYLVEARGVSVQAAGFYTTAPFLVSAVFAPLGGRLCDALSGRIGKPLAQTGLGIAGLSIAALCLASGAVIQHPLQAVLVLSLGAGAIYASMPAYWAASVEISPRHAGVASGFMNMGCNVGGVISPTLTPWLAERFGWTAALLAAAAIALCGALCWMFASAPSRKAAAAVSVP